MSFITKKCLRCFIDIKVKIYIHNKGGGLFCSKSCRAIFNNYNREIINPYQRFISKVCVTENCWEWNGCKNNCGYGEFKVNQQMIKAHRFSWIYKNGQIPEGMCILHKCDNPSCVNPDHLFIGTPKDNALDRKYKNRGHRPMGEKCANSKLRNSDVLAIKQRMSLGENRATLARKYNVSWTTISNIKDEKTWRHIKGVTQ